MSNAGYKEDFEAFRKCPKAILITNIKRFHLISIEISDARHRAQGRLSRVWSRFSERDTRRLHWALFRCSCSLFGHLSDRNLLQQHKNNIRLPPYFDLYPSHLNCFYHNFRSNTFTVPHFNPFYHHATHDLCVAM